MSRCDNCMYQGNWRCHLHPPILIVRNGLSLWDFPAVGEDEWCGDGESV